MTNSISEAESGTKKIKKNRSTSYPSIALKEAIEYIGKIQDAYGNSSFDRENGVKAMGYNKVTGDSGMKISALVQYQLLDREGNTYKLSELADRVLNHTSEEDKAAAIATAATNPKLFSKLVNAFSRQAIPALLNNILVREHKINRTVSDRLAKTFKESLEFAGLYSNGVITANPAIDADPERGHLPINLKDNTGAHTKTSVQPMHQAATGSLQSIPLSGGVVLCYPHNLSFQFGIGKFGTYIQQLDSAIKAELEEIDKTNDTTTS